ncbi:MAG: spermidine synthase, partial [Candidatus Acidiferrales bacterium]
MILPWFGAVAAVWAVCLLFFQAALLLGYLYAHLLARYFTPRAQGWIHAALVAASLFFLPILPNDLWKPVGTEDPAWRILALLGATVGLPYFLLSSTTPLLQSWFARDEPGLRPYRFYALSNAGSMLALLSFPTLVEPNFSSVRQAFGWSFAYAVVAVLCAAIGFRANGKVATLPANLEVPLPDWKTQSLWIALAACGSALLLSITNHISQNIAAVPFLWIIPLCLYLLSFILCFEGPRWYRRDLFIWLLCLALAGMAYALGMPASDLRLSLLILIFCSGLFICCMFCHGELARLKPPSAHSTRFYLFGSIGGAAGAVFVALLAPRVFSGFYELEISMALCGILLLLVRVRDPGNTFFSTGSEPGILVIIALLVTLLASLGRIVRQQGARARLMERNFYGVLRVMDEIAPYGLAPNGIPYTWWERRYIRLMNGAINHGMQFLAEERRKEPTSYYSPVSGIGVALTAAGRRSELRVGIIGLGAGTLAAYGRPGDQYTFYEINPLDVRIAQQDFSFLADSKAKIQIVLGDGRLALEREAPQQFDVIVVDAFSGDSIPVHLLTREAFELYFHHLKPDGVLAIHVSNLYLNLQPVVLGAAASLRKEAVSVKNQDDLSRGILASNWILVGSREGFVAQNEIERAGTILSNSSGGQLWTDDYSSLFRVLK